jgi:hypothetical protein
MKHPSSQSLYDYWNHRRGARPAPERGDIEPAVIRAILGDTFILAYDNAADHPFRLVGTKVCSLFGRELKGNSFLQLWDPESRRSARELIDVVADECVGLVAGTAGSTSDGASLDLELLLLPLTYRGHAHARILGVLAPMTMPYWLGTSPIAELCLGSRRHLGPAVETLPAPRFMPASETARRRHGLVVHEGGRAE